VGPLRISVVSAALTLATAMSVLPVQVANAQPSNTTVVVPSANATVSGTSQILDALATLGATQVQYEITGGTLTDSVIATARPTYYGWFAQWNTTTVANGTYTLQSVASYSGGVNATSAGISVTVDNPAPATTVVLPANNATISGTTVYFDATASSGVTKNMVTYEVSGGPSDLSDVQVATGTGTLIGWLAAWNTTTVPNGTYTLQSVASYSGGISGTSPPITINVNNPPPSVTIEQPSMNSTVGSNYPDTNESPVTLDAVTSPGVTQVVFNGDFVSIDGSGPGPNFTATATLTAATPTISAWSATIYPPACDLCGPLAYIFTAVASYSGDVSGDGYTAFYIEEGPQF